ncbi:hypothetical protein D3C73_833710 [compost metagenome]
MLGARNRNQVITLGQHPRQRQLARRHAFFCRQRLYLLHQQQVFREVFALKARAETTVIVGREIIRAFQRAGQKPSAQWAIRHKGDAQALAGRQATVFFLIAAPQRVLALQRTDRMNLVRSLQGRRRGLAQAQITHLAGTDQFGHGADGFFDGHLRIDTVLVIQVEGVHAQAFQAAVDGLANVFRPTVDAPGSGVRRVADDTELAGQEHLVALAGNGLADQLFIGVRAVHIGGIEQVDTQFQRAMQGRRGFAGIGAGGVEVGHAHAAKADGRHLRTVLSQLTCVHEISSL